MAEVIELPHLEIDPQWLGRHSSASRSSYCTVAFNARVDGTLYKRYGRTGLCLKLFPEVGEGDHVRWSKVPLRDTSVVQNLLAWHGLAPRVYDIVWVNHTWAAQVTDFVVDDGEPCEVDIFIRLLQKYGVGYRTKNLDIGARNWVGSKMVDFGGLYLKLPGGFVATLAEEAYTRRGENIGSAYQPVKPLGIRGQRDIGSRVEEMGLDELKFKGKRVLDMGCNLGAFMRDAHDRGAKRVVGIDRRNIPGLAWKIAVVLGYWNLDFIDLPLSPRIDNVGMIRNMSGFGVFDAVYCMAVQNYFGGYKSWISELVTDGGVMFLEGHGGEGPDKYASDLSRDFGFRQVDFLGYTEDNYKRPLFRCWK